MSQLPEFSSPESLPSSPCNNTAQPEDLGFEGVATNVRVLLKLIHEHNGVSPRDSDMRKSHRVAGMISIIDEVRSRIQKIQTSNKRRAELRRCNTDLKCNIPREKRTPDQILDEKERLRRELVASLASRRNLQVMCSSLGKEKQIMASELSRKAQELTEMEEFIHDLKAQNEMLMERLQACSSKLKEKKSNGDEVQGNIALQERNKALTEQLQKSLDGYRSLKRKFNEAKEEKLEIQETMEEIEVEVQAGIDRIHGVKELMITTNEEAYNIKEEISAVEQMLESLSMKISKHRQKKA